MKKVVKFGGTSLADAGQIRKAAEIIKADPSRKYVVVSAPGKRSKEDIKVTDLLYSHAFDKVKERFDEIIKELGISLNLDKEYAEIEKNVTGGCTDAYLASRGEYLNGLVISAYLGFEFVDPKDAVFFKSSGMLNAKKTNSELRKRLAKVEYAVIPGFYGSDEETGVIVTFSRGGSDVTGSIVAQAVTADEYENWTDVSGFKLADPRIIEDPETIESITYGELRELSYMGASVLHEDAVFPVKEANIPINVRNTNKPDDRGTIILDSIAPSEKDPRVTGIAGRKGFAAFALYKQHMADDPAFLSRAMGVFLKFGVTVEHMPSGIDSVSFVVKEKEVSNRVYDIIAALREELKPDDVKYMGDISLIAVVGRNMATRPGTSGKIFTALGADKVNVKIIIQSFDEINILVGVATEDFDRAVKAIYHSFD